MVGVIFGRPSDACCEEEDIHLEDCLTEFPSPHRLAKAYCCRSPRRRAVKILPPSSAGMKEASSLSCTDQCLCFGALPLPCHTLPTCCPRSLKPATSWCPGPLLVHLRRKKLCCLPLLLKGSHWRTALEPLPSFANTRVETNRDPTGAKESRNSITCCLSMVLPLSSLPPSSCFCE